MVGYDDYSIIPEDEIEWYSSRRGSTHPYGLLIRTMSEEEYKAMMKKCKLDEWIECNNFRVIRTLEM